MAEANTAREQALELNRVIKLWEAWRDRVSRLLEGIGVWFDSRLWGGMAMNLSPARKI